METKLRLFIYGNTACMNRRPTMVEDCEDYWEEDINVNNAKEAYISIVKSLYDWEEDELEDLELPQEEDDLEETLNEFCGEQDYGDGSEILYAVYDLTNKKWIVGDENSKREWLIEYIDEEEYEEEGYDLDDLSEMNIGE